MHLAVELEDGDNGPQIMGLAQENGPAGLFGPLHVSPTDHFSLAGEAKEPNPTSPPGGPVSPGAQRPDTGERPALHRTTVLGLLHSQRPRAPSLPRRPTARPQTPAMGSTSREPPPDPPAPPPARAGLSFMTLSTDLSMAPSLE